MRFLSATLLLACALAATALPMAHSNDLIERDDFVEVPQDLFTRFDSEIDVEGRDIVDLDGRDDVMDLESRRGGRGGGIGDAAVMIVDLVKGLKGQVKADKMARGQFTNRLMGELNQKNPKLNYVVCHTRHRTRFDGRQGVDWTHRHQEFDVKFGGTVGYEIYAFKSGEFWRQGDGGYLNWAFIGNVLKRQDNGKHLVFGPR